MFTRPFRGGASVHNSSVRRGGLDPLGDEAQRAEDRARSTPAKRVGDVLEKLTEKPTPRAGGGGRAAPRPTPDVDFFEELKRRAPTIARAVDVAGGPAALLELPRPAAEVPAPAGPELELRALEAWAPHSFPARKKDGRPQYLERKVCRATRAYPCASIDVAPGHCSEIQPGTQYVRVNFQVSLGHGKRWRHVLLCRACAIAYGLAETHTPGGEDGSDAT